MKTLKHFTAAAALLAAFALPGTAKSVDEISDEASQTTPHRPSMDEFKDALPYRPSTDAFKDALPRRPGHPGADDFKDALP